MRPGEQPSAGRAELRIGFWRFPPSLSAASARKIRASGYAVAALSTKRIDLQRDPAIVWGMEHSSNGPPRKKKKVDYAALQSPFMRIPGMNTAVARDLLDAGFRQVHELEGRAPEVIFGHIKDLRPATPREHLFRIRLAVYFAETPEPDPGRLDPWVWTD